MIRYERTSQSANAGARSEGARWVNPTTIHHHTRPCCRHVYKSLHRARSLRVKSASPSIGILQRVEPCPSLYDFGELVRADRFPWNYDSWPKDVFSVFFNLEGEQTTGNMNLQSCRVGILVLILFLNGEFFEKSVP